MLFYALATARMFNLGLVETLEILRPGSRLRKALLPRITNPFLFQSLAYLDSLSASRQEELVASSLARLEPFLCDPAIFRMLTHAPSLDITEVIARHQVLLVNLEIGQPLVEDDVKLFGRFLVNDILNSVRRMARDRKPSPVYLICDEVQYFMTRDLCQALATGRELGLHLIAAHQELSQLRDEDKGGDLYHSLMGCARTRILLGGLSFEDLKILVPDVMADQYSPRLVKDEITSLEIEPVESTREVVTNGTSIGGSLGASRGTSSSASRGRAHGVSRQFGSSYTHGEGVSSLHSYGTSFGVGDG